MRYISVFSGIEAASVAAEPLGWEPVAFCEIDPFASAVLAYRFPDVPNLGDITQVDWSEYAGAVDLVVGGSPCQSFSVAGLRAGLADPRGNLMLEYLKCCSVVDPEWVVWENVPGVLSSDKGNDFQAFLGAVAELWPGGGVCWRVLDAQFFGVAQRRRRVFAVINTRDWRRAAAVLFEPGCLSGDLASSREKRKELAACAERGTGGGVAGFKYHNGPKSRSIGYGVEQSPTVTSDWHSPAVFGIRGNVIGRDVLNGGNQTGVSDPEEDGFYTLDATDVHAVAFQQNQRDEVRLMGGDGDVAGAISASQFTKGQNFVCMTDTQDNTNDEGESDNPVICMATGQGNAEVMVDKPPTITAFHEHPIITCDD